MSCTKSVLCASGMHVAFTHKRPAAGHSLLDAHLLLILALLGLQVQDNEDGAGHDHCHDVGPPARSGHLQSSGHRSLQLKRFWHCCSCGASQRAGGHRSATKHERLSAQSHKGQCQEEGRKQHKLGSHWYPVSLPLTSWSGGLICRWLPVITKWKKQWFSGISLYSISSPHAPFFEMNLEMHRAPRWKVWKNMAHK